MRNVIRRRLLPVPPRSAGTSEYDREYLDNEDQPEQAERLERNLRLVNLANSVYAF